MRKHRATRLATLNGEASNEWSYRGGLIEHLPKIAGRRGKWSWQVCGAGGWVNNKKQAQDKIDSLLEAAKVILEAERSN